MKKLLKFLLWLLAIVIVLIIVAYLTAGIWVRTAVSTLLPQMTKTDASLEEADISLLSGKISFKGFKIANPAGFSSKNAFELGEVSVKFEPKSLFTSKVIINEIRINGTKINAEIAKTGNMNLMLLNNNIQEYLGNPVPTQIVTDQKQLQPKEKPASSKAVVVKDLQISNSSVDFVFLTQKTTLKLPNIHEKNIGEKKKETLPDLIADIFGTLNTSSFQEISKVSRESVNKMLDSVAGRSKEAAGYINVLKNEIKNMF